MKQEINETKSLQELAGVDKQSQLNEVISPIHKNRLRLPTYKKIDTYLKSIIGKPFDKKMADDISIMAFDLARDYFEKYSKDGFQK